MIKFISIDIFTIQCFLFLAEHCSCLVEFKKSYNTLSAYLILYENILNHLLNEFDIVKRAWYCGTFLRNGEQSLFCTWGKYIDQTFFYPFHERFMFRKQA